MGIRQPNNSQQSNSKLIYKTPITLEKRLEHLEAGQEKITFIVGGQIFQTTKETITSSYFDSYFKKLNLKDKNEFFIDRSFTDFELILDILRQSCLITYSKNEEIIKTQKQTRKRITDADIFYEDLKFYFDKDLPRVEQIFNLANITNYKECNGLIHNYEIVNQNKDNKLDYMFYTAKDIRELFTANSRKAFFIENNGALIINLTVKGTVDKMELRPFVFDKDYFDHHECIGVFIYTSTDRSNWHYVAKAKFSPQNDWISTIYLNSSTLKYLKITTDKYNCPLSISYIKLFN
jgi:hypothetical protein